MPSVSGHAIPSSKILPVPSADNAKLPFVPPEVDIFNVPMVSVMLPATFRLPTFELPVTSNVPEMFAVPNILAPVPVTINVVLPTEVILILPLADGIFTLLFPFANVPIILPTVALPVTVKVVSDPTLVIFG